jgi:hypothetical protein
MRSGLAILLGLLSTAMICAVRIGPATAQVFTVTPDLYSIFIPTPTPAETHEEAGPTSVFQHLRQEFQPDGFWWGGQHILSSATVSSVFDDNIFVTHTAPTGDLVSHFRPDLALDNGEELISYSFDLYGDFAKYARHSSLDSINGGAALGVVANIAPTLRLESRTNVVDNHADPAGFVLPVANGNLDHLPQTNLFQQQLAVTRDIGPFGFALSGGYSRSQEDNLILDGIPFLLSQLNSNVFDVTSKVSYDLAPDLRDFIQGDYRHESYADGTRNAAIYSIATGIDFELDRLIRGTIDIGYRQHAYDTSGFGSVSGPTYSLNLAWYPTEVLTATLIGSQDYTDNILTRAAGGAVVSKVIGTPVVSDTKTLEAAIDYAVMSQLVFSLNTSYGFNSYVTTRREDDSTSAGLGLLYTIGPDTVVSAQYQFETRSSTAAAIGYDRNRVGAALKLQF